MSKFLQLFVATNLFSVSLMAAGLPGLETAYDRLLWKTQSSIGQLDIDYKDAPSTCNKQTLEIRKDGKIDITVVFGYMDVSNGQDFQDSGNYLYGPGNVLDMDAKNSLRNILKSRCMGSEIHACGFKGSGDVLTKKIKDRWTRKRMNVTIRLAAPAVTPYDSVNKGQKKAQQQSSSANVKNLFLSGLQSADAVMYLGHARSGGGPDFKPPVLTSSGKVNYSYYKSKQEGIKSMLSALQGASRKPPVIGVLSCKSTGLFASRIKKKAPNSLLVTAADLFDYNDILPTGYAMLEALLGQRCTGEFNSITKVQPASSKFLHINY